jgi:hypothetical protein
MVVHGRNLAARNAMYAFLLALGLSPIDWASAVRETGKGAPHNLEAARAAIEAAQAVVVVFTAEDEARLLPSLVSTSDSPEEADYRGQPRPNVLLEAGMAFALAPTRTIIVELGPVARASDLEGLNAVRITNGRVERWALRDRLVKAGCAIAEHHGQFLETGLAGDFDAAVQTTVGNRGGLDMRGAGFALGSVLDHHLEAFRVTGDSRLEHTWFPAAEDGARWEPWRKWTFPHAALDVAVTSGWPNHMEVFVLGLDGAVWHRWWIGTKGWSEAFLEFGRPFSTRADAIAAASLRHGHMEVQVRAADGRIRHVWYDRGWRFLGSGMGWRDFSP